MNPHIYIFVALALSLISCAEKPKDGVNKLDAEMPKSIFSVLPTSTRTELISCGVGHIEFEKLLKLSRKDFDQDFEGGWRKIGYQDKCENAAAEIIKAYILYSHPIPAGDIKLLKWHAAQTKANAGKYRESIALFRGTYDSDNEHQEWNLYVDATLAFLNEDKESLQQARDTLAVLPVSEKLKIARKKFLQDNPNISMPKNFIDEPQNLTVIERLLTCYGQPYKTAYFGCKEK